MIDYDPSHTLKRTYSSSAFPLSALHHSTMFEQRYVSDQVSEELQSTNGMPQLVVSGDRPPRTLGTHYSGWYQAGSERGSCNTRKLEVKENGARVL